MMISPRPFDLLIILFTCTTWADTLSVQPDSVVALEKMRVVASEKRPEQLSVEMEQSALGLTDDISNILIAAPGVNRIPEAGSAILVKGSGRYDNGYEINGIPLFAPSHFSGSRFADRNATLIPTINTIELNTGSLSGRVKQKTGAYISVESGMMRWAKLDDKFHLGIHLGSLHREVYVTAPRIGKHSFQLAFAKSDDYLFKAQNNQSKNAYRVDELGNESFFGIDTTLQSVLTYGEPVGFMNVSLTTESDLEKATVKGHFWLSRDTFTPFENGNPPHLYWGSGSVSYIGEGEVPLRITLGGSRQYHHESTLRGPRLLLKKIERSNAILRADIERLNRGENQFDFGVMMEALDWAGEMTILSRDSLRQVTDTKKTDATGQNELSATLHAGVGRRKHNMVAGIDLLGSAQYPSNSAYIDPSIRMSFLWRSSRLDTRLGITGIQPDIRGLPQRYRQSLYRAYSGTIGLSSFAGDWLKSFIEFYGRYTDDAPRFSSAPLTLAWDERESTPLYAGGTTVRFDFSMAQRLYLRTVTDIGMTRRRVGDEWRIYEYDIPWSNKSTLHLVAAKEKLDLYLTSHFTAGLPYRNVIFQDSMPVAYGHQVHRMPYYRRIDFKAVFGNEINNHPFLTRYNVYISILNVCSFAEGLFKVKEWYWKNHREYYWDEYGDKIAVELQDFMFSFGLQLGIHM